MELHFKRVLTSSTPMLVNTDNNHQSPCHRTSLFTSTFRVRLDWISRNGLNPDGWETSRLTRETSTASSPQEPRLRVFMVVSVFLVSIITAFDVYFPSLPKYVSHCER